MPPDDPRAPYILLVEDDDVDAMAVERGLRKLGCRTDIHRVRDGQEALEMLAAAAIAPHGLLVDINMPRMSGLELIHRLRQDMRFDVVEIFVLTTSKLEDDRRAAEELCVAGFMTKDDASEAYARLAEVMRRARQVLAQR